MSGPTPRRLLTCDAASATVESPARSGRRSAATAVCSASALGFAGRSNPPSNTAFMLWEAYCALGAKKKCLSAPFSDDALAYFTERLDPGPTRRAFSVACKPNAIRPLEHQS